jgi:hypothetical protein
LETSRINPLPDREEKLFPAACLGCTLLHPRTTDGCIATLAWWQQRREGMDGRENRE